MSLLQVGWREWAALPELGIALIKVKIDTGARTSALHAFRVQTFEREGRAWLRFKLHPQQRDEQTVCTCEAPLLEYRRVSDSGGHSEVRPVILTRLSMGGRQWPIEVTLTDRDSMAFRMLLGRTAMQDMQVDPHDSFLLGKP